MELFLNDATYVWYLTIGLIFLFIVIFLWRYNKNKLIQQAYEAQLRANQLKITQLEQANQTQQKELDQLDIERDKLAYELKNSHGQLMAAQERLSLLPKVEQEVQLLQDKNNQLQQQNTELIASLREQQASHQQSARAAQEKLELLERAEQRLKTEFENLASQVFEHKVKHVDSQNKQSLEAILNPLKEQLQGFKQQVSDTYQSEARERHTLVHEIKQLQKLNQQMAQDAVNLTQALKGDNKQQGNWGEVVLGKILQDSGLREGHEYQTQVSLENDDGKRYQPDVVVNLPENKQIIIDSKVTLVAFERYFSSEDDADKAKALNEHVIAVRSHIKQLGQKDYQQLKGITSLDYVLLFIPIEPAFQLAIEKDPSLIKEAMEQNIIVVSPTTLLVALRTINNLWRNERQNQNAKIIAEQASKLYDKMRLFVGDMEDLGKAINRAQQSYDGAMNKLSTGRGNLIRQAESFKSLGVKVKKDISPELAEQAETEPSSLIAELSTQDEFVVEQDEPQSDRHEPDDSVE